MEGKRKLSFGLVSYSGSSGEDNSSDEESVAVNEKKGQCKFQKVKHFTESSTSKEAMRGKQSAEKGKSVLPPPSGILQMFDSQETQHVDDASLHEGRVRSFAHERGNWATFVYVPISARDLVQELAVLLAEHLETFTEFKIFDSFHISVSRCVAARHHWISPLIDSLKQSLGNVHQFTCNLSSLEFYCNDEKTRTFLGLKVHGGVENLKQIVAQVDNCFSEFRLQKYYKEPSFHMSIAWALGDLTLKITQETKETLQAAVEEFLGMHPMVGLLDITELECKTGNKVYALPLR